MTDIAEILTFSDEVQCMIFADCTQKFFRADTTILVSEASLRTVQQYNDRFQNIPSTATSRCRLGIQ